MANSNKKFGEAFFAELNDDTYLHKIYEDILFNYSIKVFSFKKRAKRHIPKIDALTFADLLSKSNHSTLADSQKMWAQEIVTMLHYLYPDDPTVTYMTGVVLANLGNYQGQKLIDSTFDGIDALDRIFGEFKKDYLAIPADQGKRFMSTQKQVYDHLQDDYFSYSGPTSMGKSYIMRMFIKQQILSGSRNNFAIIVPTKALINEVRTKTTEDLGLSLKEYRYHLVTAAGDAALKIDDKSRRYVFIMTPERLLYLLMNEKDIQLDYLFIDEAQKLSGDDTRSPFYYQVVQILSEAEQKPHIIFASPNVPNPQVYLNSISGVETETLNQHKLASGFSPVTQIKFLINLESKEVSVYNEHTKELMPITSVALQDAELTDVLLRFEKDDQGKEKQCIVYFSSVRKTVDAARDFAANRVAKTENAELIELAKDIKNEVHNDYYLAELVSKGVAYHIGYLPASIRQRIERLFHEGAITAIFCTSTLVEGVNLPADNLFITDFKNGLSHMSAIDFNITKLIINFTKKLAEYRTSKGEALSDEKQDLISENITALSNLKQHTLPVFDIKANAEEEDVSEIFVRVNSGGVALKQNDFILTLLSLYWDEGRKEIEQFSMESTYPSKDKITSYNQLTEVTAQDVIRVVMAYAFDRARLKYGYKLLRGADFDKKGAVDETLRDQRFDVLKAKLPDVLNVHNWHEFLKSIMNAGYLSGDLILSGNAIYYTYAFYLIAKYRFNASYNENMHLTSLWFFYASMVSLYTGSFESTVENHLNSIKELTTLEEYKRFILSRVVERLTNDYFDITLIGSEGLAVSGRGNNAWNAYAAALNILNAKILFSKSNLLVSKLFEPGTDGKRKSLEKHHLFPKAYLKTLGYNDAKINQMANYAFIDWKDNMEILDEAPAIYYPVVCEGRSPEEIQRMEEENALPHGWENMSYEDFLIERRKLMATKIKQAFEILKNNAN